LSPRGRLWVAALVALAAGCTNVGEACDGVEGTCLSLTVTSSQVATVDALHIVASGAVTGTHDTTSPTPLTLPVHVAIKLTTPGAVHFDVAGVRGGATVGTGQLDTTLAAGEHQSRSVDIEPAGGGDGGTDAGDGGGIVCDPRGVLAAACVWRWQTPLPQGEEIIGVHAFADNDIIAYTKANTVLHRDGNGWTVLPTQPTAALGVFSARGFAGGGNDLYVTGFNSQAGQPPDIFRSTDKGMTWTEQTLPSFGNPAPFFWDIATNGTDTIVVSSDGDIMQRNSGTGVWNNRNFTFGFGTGVTHFQGAHVGTVRMLAVGNHGGTTPGGLIAYASTGTAIWNAVSPNPTPNQLFSACSGTGAGGTFQYWAVGVSGTIVTSTDGMAWSTQTSNTANDLYGCDATDATHVTAWGRNGTVVRTTDGVTWSPLVTNVADVLEGGSHSPGATFTVGGQTGTLLRIVDGSATFMQERTGPNDPWFALYGFAPHTVYAGGFNGSLVRTTDGVTWQRLVSGSTQTITALWGSSPNDVYAVGTAGTVLHSTNGTTFVKYMNPATGGIPAADDLTSVSGLSAGDVYAIGTAGLYHTTDNGSTWTPVTVTGMSGVPSAVFAMGGEIWVGGPMGQIFHSSNGTTWTAQPIPGPLGNLDTVGRIRGRMPGDLFASYVNAPMIAHSANGGAAWTVIAPMTGILGVDTGLFDIAPTPSGNYIYASGQSGFVVSQDEAANWNFVNTHVSSNTTAGLFAFSDTDVYAIVAGGSGGILHYGP
jgi:hypothetical protein